MKAFRKVYWTQEQKQFVIDEIGKCNSYQELLDKINKQFGTNRTLDSLKSSCAKGYLGKKVSIPSSTRFKKGEQLRSLPVGTIRKSQTGTYIKVLEVEPTGEKILTGYKRPWWIPLQQKIYEDAYGKLPDGYMVCFLNHNNEDFSLKNLYPITRKISATMAKNKWYSENPEITLTAIKCCELICKSNDILRGKV